MEDTTASPSCCLTVDGFARWLGMGIAAAFFASLERCSCVNIDADGEDDEEADDRPLMLTKFPSFASTASASSAANHISRVNNSAQNIPV